MPLTSDLICHWLIMTISFLFIQKSLDKRTYNFYIVNSIDNIYNYYYKNNFKICHVIPV